MSDAKVRQWGVRYQNFIGGPMDREVQESGQEEAEKWAEGLRSRGVEAEVIYRDIPVWTTHV